MATKLQIDNHCKKCRWSGYISGFVCCDYILYNRKPRGCPADLDCERFEPKTKNYRSQITISTKRMIENRKRSKEEQTKDW